MDLFGRAYIKLLIELYQSMAPGSRLTAGLLGTVVLVSAGYLLTHQGTAPDAELMHGLPVNASQLPAMLAAFSKASLKTYEIRGNSIFVPRSQEADYMAALAAGNALPQRPGAAQQQAASENGMFEFGPQRDQRMRIAKQEELAQGIREMSGIENAWVIYDESKPEPFKDRALTAMAMVKPTGANRLDAALVSAIRSMVARSFAGMHAEDVAVTDLSAGRTWIGNSDDVAGGSDNVYLSLKRTYEQDLKTNIQGALRFIPNVSVATSVVLDRQRFTHVKQERRSAPDDRHDARKTSRPAATTPTAETILNGILGGGRVEEEKSEPDAAESISRVQVEKESVGLTPTLAGVSVGVPMSYFKSVWLSRNAAAAGQSKTPDQTALDRIRIEESANIQRLVAQLLPSTDSAAKTMDMVTVTTFPDIPVAEPPPPPEFRQEVLTWARQSWKTLAAIVVALVSLLAMWSMVHTPGDRAEAEPAPARGKPTVAKTSNHAERSGNRSGRPASPIPAPHARAFHEAEGSRTAPPSPDDELSEMVEENPEAAVNVLRSWIGQVG